MYWFFRLGTVLLACVGVDSSHFRGGTISWKPTGNGNEVQFSFKLGWAYNTGPGCTSEKIGQLVTKMNTSYWQCTSGCSSVISIANVNYICTGASQSENWEQGERTFTYTFPGIGPYTVEFKGNAWVTLSYGSPGSWSIGTVVYLAKRNDTYQPNISPVTTGKPLYRVQYGCQSEIVIPVVDADGDDVKCRWSSGSECVSICNALPGATIDRDTCTIRFPATHTAEGTFAVAVTVQDFPKTSISIGSQVYLPTYPISTVTLQFLIKTPSISSSNCNDKPKFVSPTLQQGSTISANVSEAVNISFYASGSRRITSIDMTTPAGMSYSSLQNYSLHTGTVFLEATWTPQPHQIGSHFVCAQAVDDLGKTSDSRCITILVEDIDDCASQPCQHMGTCIDGLNKFTCLCAAGFNGQMCETDIDECASQPCQHQGTCLDGINQFSCLCSPGYTGKMCEWDIDECASQPCQHHGICIDGINQFTCLCLPGYTGKMCETDIDECASQPCQNSGACTDAVNQFHCSCLAGFTDNICQTNIDECASHPCQNQGTCNDGINQFTCLCPPEYTGQICETEINECSPDPCNFLFTCEDRINEYHCRLIEWRLALIITSVFLLTFISFVIIYLKSAKMANVDQNCLTKFMNTHNADVKPVNNFH